MPTAELESLNTACSFANNFWGKEDAGVQPLIERMLAAKQTCDELKNFYAVRASIEEDYSRKLNSLAKKPLGSLEMGTLKVSLDTLRGEVESMGKQHSGIAAQLKTELEEPLAAFAGGMKERRKIIQNTIEKLLKIKVNQTNTVNKTRDRYEQDCLKIKGYLAQGHMVMGQEERKNKARLEKTQISMASTNADYENAVKALEETTGRWNKEWKATADKFQDLEEERLDFTKSSLWTFANIASTVCVSDDASCEKVRLALEDMEVEKDIMHFINERGTGSDIPDPPKYINFCRGDVDDHDSIASLDEDNYQLAQFPRSINPAFRSSSPQPSTYESHHDPNSSLARDMAHQPASPTVASSRETTVTPQKAPAPVVALVEKRRSGQMALQQQQQQQQHHYQHGHNQHHNQYGQSQPHPSHNNMPMPRGRNGHVQMMQQQFDGARMNGRHHERTPSNQQQYDAPMQSPKNARPPSAQRHYDLPSMRGRHDRPSSQQHHYDAPPLSGSGRHERPPSQQQHNAPRSASRHSRAPSYHQEHEATPTNARHGRFPPPQQQFDGVPQSNPRQGQVANPQQQFDMGAQSRHGALTQRPFDATPQASRQVAARQQQQHQAYDMVDIAPVPHDPYPLDGMTMLCRTGGMNSATSSNLSGRPSSRDDNSLYSNPTSLSSAEPASGKVSPTKQQPDPKQEPQNRFIEQYVEPQPVAEPEPEPVSPVVEAPQSLVESSPEKRVFKKRSGFFQAQSPFRRKSQKDLQSKGNNTTSNASANPTSNATSNVSAATNRNTWAAANTAARSVVNGNASPRRLQIRQPPQQSVVAERKTASPEPIDANASLALNVGNNVFAVSAPNKEKKPVESPTKEEDPIALALAELKGVANNKTSSIRMSADHYHGISTPQPGQDRPARQDMPQGRHSRAQSFARPPPARAATANAVPAPVPALAAASSSPVRVAVPAPIRTPGQSPVRNNANMTPGARGSAPMPPGAQTPTRPAPAAAVSSPVVSRISNPAASSTLSRITAPAPTRPTPASVQSPARAAPVRTTTAPAPAPIRTGPAAAAAPAPVSSPVRPPAARPPPARSATSNQTAVPPTRTPGSVRPAPARAPASAPAPAPAPAPDPVPMSTPLAAPPTPSSPRASVDMGANGRTPPPSYDQPPVQRLGVPAAAVTKKAMEETSRKYLNQTRDMFSNPSRPGSSYAGNQSRPGTRNGEPPRATSPAPTRAGATSPAPTRAGATSPGPAHSDSRQSYRSASPNPYTGGGGSHQRSHSQAPSHASNRTSGQGFYSSDGMRAASPASYRGGEYDRPGSSHLSAGMSPAMDSGSNFGGSVRGQGSRPGTSHSNMQMQFWDGRQDSEDGRGRTQSVADPSRQYTQDGRAILHYARAMYMYQAAIPEELGFSKGDYLAVLRHQDDGWWEAEIHSGNGQGRSGLVPSNYLEVC